MRPKALRTRPLPRRWPWLILPFGVLLYYLPTVAVACVIAPIIWQLYKEKKTYG